MRAENVKGTVEDSCYSNAFGDEWGNMYNLLKLMYFVSVTLLVLQCVNVTFVSYFSK